MEKCIVSRAYVAVQNVIATKFIDGNMSRLITLDITFLCRWICIIFEYVALLHTTSIVKNENIKYLEKKNTHLQACAAELRNFHLSESIG